ncbi:MAG: RNA 2',3'-cyclic phosphodiesterase [Desulfobacteraceae bacterium]|nr:RNA 2',3'-cyclic phosphodiesterase [Desulfobacteraceae bacterium]
MRTFIAFNLQEHIISHIRTVQNSMKSHEFKASWVRPENIHLTLKFLGNINEADVEKIGRKISDSASEYSPISLAAKGVGVFPGIKRPRVIWIGLKGQTDILIELQKKLDENLEQIGFPRENRPFKAHLTLARIRGHIDSKKLLDAIKEIGDFESETFIAGNLTLFKSDLKPTGAVYTKLVSAKL